MPRARMGGVAFSRATRYRSQLSAPLNWSFRTVPGAWMCGSHLFQRDPEFNVVVCACMAGTWAEVEDCLRRRVRWCDDLILAIQFKQETSYQAIRGLATKGK